MMKVFLLGTPDEYIGTMESIAVTKPGKLPAIGVVELIDDAAQQLKSGMQLKVQGPETTKIYRIEVKEQEKGLARILFYEL